MAVMSRCLWFLIIVVVRAQKSPQNDDGQSTPSLKTTSAKTTPRKFLSYNPSRVCFNPQYDPYFENDLLSTCPLPQPNVYFDNELEPVAYPKSFDHSRRNNFPASSWPGLLPGHYVPLVYIPALPTNAGVNHRMKKYLQNLKNVLDADLLLASRNRSAAVPKKHFEIKFEGFPSADALPEAFSEALDNAAQRKETGEAGHIDEIKAQKMAAHLKNYYRRRRNREKGGSNVYPLPKFVYNDHQIPQPTTFYDKNFIWSEIFNQNN